MNHRWDFASVLDNTDALLAGAAGTLRIFAICIVAGLLLGLAVGLGRTSQRRWILWPAFAFVEFFRNTPVLVQILWFYFALPMLVPFAISPLARTGTTLQVRADALQARPRLIPNVLTGLVAATSVGLGLAMFFLVRDFRQRAQVEQALVAEGRDRAWRVFRLHVLDGAPYGDLEAPFALSRQQMADLVRGVTARLRKRIEELLDEEGRFGDDGVDDIIRSLG
jgi:His/Glu/Gln/Arg/opine family amino acid ABC transporter permease subunit